MALYIYIYITASHWMTGAGYYGKKRNTNRSTLILLLPTTNALLRMSVNPLGVKLYCIYRGRFILLKENFSSDIGLDKDPECVYWVSYQVVNRSIIYGKHIAHTQNTCFQFSLPKSNKSPQQYWMNKITHYRIDTSAVTYLSASPVEAVKSQEAGINFLTTR